MMQVSTVPTTPRLEDFGVKLSDFLLSSLYSFCFEIFDLFSNFVWYPGKAKDEEHSKMDLFLIKRLQAEELHYVLSQSIYFQFSS